MKHVYALGRDFAPYTWSAQAIFYLGPFDHLFSRQTQRCIGGQSESNGIATGAAELLIAEGNRDHIFFLKRVLAKAGLLNKSTFVRDGAQLLKYLSAVSREEMDDRLVLPKLILLDPATRSLIGFEILHWLRGQPRLNQIPVVIFTSLEDSSNRKRALELGVQQYRLKDPDVALWLDTLLEIATQFGLTPGAGVPPRQVERCLEAA